MTTLRTLGAAGGALVLAAAVYAGVFGPGPNSVTVPSTSQTLTVVINQPPDNSTIGIPPGTVQLQANCTIGPTQNNCSAGTTVNVLYVLDVSGSTDLDFMLQNGIPLVDANGNGIAGDAGDDFNGDGERGDIMDGEIAGVLALNASVGNPSAVNVGVIAFATNAAAADMKPTPPNTGGITQVFTNPPQVDLDGLNGPDVAEVLRSIDSNFNTPSGGQIAKFTLVPRANLGSSTDFTKPLTAINATLTQFPPGKNIVFFLSDGASNPGFRCIDPTHPCQSQLTTAVQNCTTINTIGVGADADPQDLTFIASSTGGTFTQVTNPSQLSTILPLLTPAGLDHAEIDGQPAVMDALGNFTKTITCVNTNPFTVTAKCVASDAAHTSVSADVTLSCVVLCGNGVVDVGVGEQCDDGNHVDGDGCDSNCTSTGCGNGIVTPPEVCDDHNLTNGDGCDSNCRPTGCGNGIVTPPETCDDGNLMNGDGCDDDCTPTGCGNGIVTPPEVCDDHNLVNGDGCDSNCTPTVCGNGIVTPPEVCDDGNLVDGDGCDSNCRPTACGNGVVTAGEQCDDGNLVNGDGCDSNCTPSACGNGIVGGSEQCDDGNHVDGDGCDSNCTPTGCGNGVVTPPEGCEPPNTPDCDALCQCIDSDGDGACNIDDNCSGLSNPGQTDSDGDGIGDACDTCTDTDGDGFGDPGFPGNTCPPDNCPEEPNPGQEDNDHDGIGDVCDAVDDIVNPILLLARPARNLTRPSGKIVVKGDFIVPLTDPQTQKIEQFFNADGGIAVRVHDQRGLDETFTWSPALCFTRFIPRNGIPTLTKITCRTADKHQQGIFKPVGRKNPAAMRFAFKFSKLAINGPFLEDVVVQISHGDGLVINRVGSIHDCQATISGLSCREQ